MPKTLTASMKTHIAQSTTTLAMCWRITRKDGTVFTFTNHDRDLRVEDVDSSGSPTGTVRTYSSNTAFDRTAVEQRKDMDVSNLDASGALLDQQTIVISSDQIQARDIEDGVWDDAEVEVFFVNHQDTSNTLGRISLYSGIISTIAKRGDAFQAEVRSKAVELKTDVIELTSPLCRADLGDSRCAVALAGFTDEAYVESVTDDDEFVSLGVTRSFVSGGPGTSDDGVTWDGTTAKLTKFTGTRGTPQRPILISNITEFRNIANDPYAAYALAADLDFAMEATETNPVINVDFHGWFDGRGFKIENVDFGTGSTASQRRALFSRVKRGAVVRRLNCENFDVASQTGSGSNMGAIAVDNEGLIVDCRSVGHDFTVGNGTVGGIAANQSGEGKFLRCFADGDVAGTGTVGAICGDNDSGNDNQVHCYFDDANDGDAGDDGSEIAVANASLGTRSAFATDVPTAAQVTALQEWLPSFAAADDGLEFGKHWDFDSTPRPRVMNQI